MKAMQKTLYSFDFDDTLCHTPRHEEGKKIWKDNTGLDWPYTGWWGKSESIDPEIFYIPRNEWVYKKYLEASSDENGVKILATGRLNKVPKMRKHVKEILRQNNLEFDEVLVIPGTEKYPENGKEGIYLNWGGDTFRFKTKLFEQLIKKTKCENLVMYDDRHEHLERFKEWAKEQNIKITIVDVVNKKERTFNV